MKLYSIGIFCSVCMGALSGLQVANAQSGAFTDIDVNRDPADPNFLTLALSNQAQADRIYDEISGRILDRFVRGEVGGLFPAIASTQARNQGDFNADQVFSGYISQTYDNFDYAVAGRDNSADFNNLWIGGDALLEEKYLFGVSLSHQSFKASGSYTDNVSSRLDGIAFFETVSINNVVQTRATADAVIYSADYDIGTNEEDIEGWLGVAYAAAEIIPDQLLLSGYISYADNEREATLTGAVEETLSKDLLPEFEPLEAQNIVSSDFRENRYDFLRREKNDQSAWNASVSATYFTDLSENLSGTVIVGAQFVAIDVGDAEVQDSFSGSFDSVPDFGIGFEDSESFERSATLPSDLEEEFGIFRVEGMLSYRQEQSIFVPFIRGSVRHYSEQLSFRSSQWDTFNYTFEEFGTGIEGTATSPNSQQSFPDFDQTFGTIEIGTTISLTPRVRARVNAMSEVIAKDLDRWGFGVSLQRRF